jgi:hypothetical protein
MRLTRAAILGLACTTLLMSHAVSAQIERPAERPVRLFPQYVGTWVLDEGASTGRLLLTPRVPLTLTIATTPTELTLTRTLRLHPGDRITDAPPPEVYRLDGSETWITDGRTGVTIDRSLRFTLVADMLALTVREASRAGGRSFTQVTDALEIDGDLLKLHRQLTSMTDTGAILVMQEPTNNFRHTYMYRRR